MFRDYDEYLAFQREAQFLRDLAAGFLTRGLELASSDVAWRSDGRPTWMILVRHPTLGVKEIGLEVARGDRLAAETNSRLVAMAIEWLESRLGPAESSRIASGHGRGAS